MKKKKSKSLFLMMLIILVPASLFSQEKEKISPYIQLQYFKNSDSQSYLKTTLTYSKDRMELPLPAMQVSFFTGGGRELLVTKMTDEKGVAMVQLEDVATLPENSEGFWPFASEFNGNDSIEAVASELEVKDVNLEMELSEADSIKTITLRATTKDGGQQVPVQGEMVMLYVPRMFSLLPIAEATLSDDGSVSVEFPSDLPGDEEGNIQIIAKFEENLTFGNVEKIVTKKWGIPASYSVSTTHRALWTKTPPTWMIFTLSILLAGVWGHYLYAIISLILIKKDAKKEEKQKNK